MEDFAQTNLGAPCIPVPSGTACAASNAPDVLVDRDFIVVIGRGFHTNVDDHIAALERVIRKQRLSYPALRGLIDLRELAVQPGAVIEILKDKNRQIWEPSDRVAVTVTATLVKMQMNRVAEGSNFRFFATIEEAREWLEIG